MPVKRQYKVKGTNDFIVLAGIFFFLCLWSVKDAWFPSEKVLTKHPQEVIVPVETAGTVEKIDVKVGDPVAEDMVLASLHRERVADEFDNAKNNYTEAKQKYTQLSSSAQTSDSAEAAAAKDAMDQALVKVDELRTALDSLEIKAPSKGMVKEIYIATYSLVEAGDQAFLIDPQDHFYLFNKSLAIFSFLLFWVFIAVHILAR